MYDMHDIVIHYIISLYEIQGNTCYIFVYYIFGSQLSPSFTGTTCLEKVFSLHYNSEDSEGKKV